MSRKEKQRDNRIKIRLSVKVGALLVGLTLVLTLSCIFIGGERYSGSILERYDKTAYQVAETASEYLTDEEWVMINEYMDAFRKGELTDSDYNGLVQSPFYQRIKSMLDDLRDNFNANDVFLCTIDLDELKQYSPEAKAEGKWKPLYYFFDCYREKEDELKFGDRSGILPDYLDDVIKALEEGKPVERFIITETEQWGNNMSAILPKLVDGKVIGVSFVEIPMVNLKEDETTFVLQISIVAVVVLIISIILGVILTRRMIVKPIRVMANEANHFVSEDRTISEKLHKIKTRDEIQMLSESLLSMELSINDYIENIREITAEKERIGAELNVANRIQAHMLPRDFDMYNSLNLFRLYATMTPAKEVGGDFYDFFMVDAESLAMVIADVSGKGVPAALFMVRAMTAIRTRTMMGGSPSDILSDVNNQLCIGNDEELFVTVWLAIVNLKTGEGMAVNAGHEHPGLCHADGSYELIKYRHGPAVATMEGIPFREHPFKLEPGDTLFVYTDGVTEATDANNELFGEERTTEALNRNPKAEPEELLRNVKAGIDEFVADAPQFDDITMLGMHYLGAGNNE